MDARLNLKPPLCLCGFTKDNKPVLGGAFQLADTHGIPLSLSIEQAKENGAVISIPHYFASAIEHGWDDIRTFDAIKQGFTDVGISIDMEKVKDGCISSFMTIANKMPNDDAVAVGKKLREWLESEAD